MRTSTLIRTGVLCALLVLCQSACAYDTWYVKHLRSLTLARVVDVNVNTETHFFEFPKQGEDATKKMLNPFEKDETDRAISYGGWVQKNIESILRDKLQREFEIRPFIRDGVASAPYQMSVQVSVYNGFNIFGEPHFTTTVKLALRERGVGPSGMHGYIENLFYSGISIANSKKEVESRIFVALEEAWGNFSKEMTKAKDYCSKNDCSQESTAPSQ